MPVYFRRDFSSRRPTLAAAHTKNYFKFSRAAAAAGDSVGKHSPYPDYVPKRSEHSEDGLMSDSPKPRMLLRSNRAKPVTEFALATTDTDFKIC